MKLSRTVWYGLQATLLLAQFDDTAPVPCSRLAAVGNMPERFLLQILRNLVAHGVLRSCRGVDGGYVLQRNPADISLLELIEAIDGPLVPGRPVGDAWPVPTRARLQQALIDVTDGVRGELSGITLADLLPAKCDEDTAGCDA